MYEDTPNKEELDWIAKRIREIYEYDRLKDCDIDYLYNLEYLIDSKLMIYEAGFPDENGPPEELRAVISDEDPTDLKEPLTTEEKLRLQLLREEAAVEIHRAFGHRKQLRRKHRSRIANAFADALKSLGNLFPW